MAASPDETLKSHGLQVTAQRLAVLRAVSSHPHAIADRIHDLALAEIGAISRQSVYDTLNSFTELGIIRRVQPIGSPALYETRVADNHHHLVCRECGGVVDIDCAVGHAPCLTADNDHGYEIDEADVTYWGICPTCQPGLRATARAAG